MLRTWRKKDSNMLRRSTAPVLTRAMWKNSWETTRGRQVQPLLRSQPRHLRRSKMSYRQTLSRRRLVRRISYGNKLRHRYSTLWCPPWKDQLNKSRPHKTRLLLRPLQLMMEIRSPSFRVGRAEGARRKLQILRREAGGAQRQPLAVQQVTRKPPPLRRRSHSRYFRQARMNSSLRRA